ncbi:DNA-binding protein [Clostridia bacterium]|nr:DNA-binding protein [Clostridia bacterium]
MSAYTVHSKKLSIIFILDILNRFSDEDHKLSQQNIVDLLKSEHNLTLDRKAVKRNLVDLIEAGYEINYDDSTTRKSKSGEEEPILKDWYIDHTFEEGELRHLIDSLLFSKHIPQKQRQDLLRKLADQSSKYFESHVKHIHCVQENVPHDSQIFYSTALLDKAISRGKQVVFNYTQYGTNKKQRIKTDRNGDPIEYMMNPYQMAATNGYYYLIGNLDGKEGLSNYRVDRIKQLRILEDKPAKPLRKVIGKNRLDLPKHMAEHIYMYSGESVRVTFRTTENQMDSIIDWFGTGVAVTELGDRRIEVSVIVNEQAMLYWALQYGPYVEILTPKSLRDSVRGALTASLAQY